jgi:hypothetical protein
MEEARLWNIGIKVADVRAEAAYFVALGGRLRLHERLATPDGEFEYALVEFGGTRLFLTPTTVFEDRLAEPVPHGLTMPSSRSPTSTARSRASPRSAPRC